MKFPTNCEKCGKKFERSAFVVVVEKDYWLCENCYKLFGKQIIDGVKSHELD